MIHVAFLVIALLGGELGAAFESPLFAESFISMPPPVSEPAVQMMAQPMTQPVVQAAALPVVQFDAPPVVQSVVAPAMPVVRKEELPQESFVDAVVRPPAYAPVAQGATEVLQASSDQKLHVEAALQAATAQKDQMQLALQAASDQKEQVQEALQAATDQKEQVVEALHAVSKQEDEAQVAFQAATNQEAQAQPQAVGVVGEAFVFGSTADQAQVALKAATQEKEQVQVALQAAVEQKDQVKVALQAASNEKAQVQVALRAASDQQVQVRAQGGDVAAATNVGSSAGANTAIGAVGTTSDHAGIPVAVAAAAAVAAAVPPVDVAVAAATAATGWWLAVETYAPQLAHVVSAISFGAVIKGLCLLGNVMVQVSPYPQVRRWENRGCTGEADAAPYVAIAFAGYQWCFYGLFAWWLTNRSGFLILVHSNFLGALLGSYYAFAFCRNCRSQPSLDSMQRYLSAVLSLVALQGCAICVLPLDRALFLTGLIASFCSFVGASSMLVTLPIIIRTRDSQSILGPFAWANLLSAVVWCACGWMLNDPLVLGPNIYAFVCSSVCLWLKYKYPSKDVNMNAEVKGNDLQTGKPAGMHASASSGTATEYTPIMEALGACSAKPAAAEFSRAEAIMEALGACSAKPATAEFSRAVASGRRPSMGGTGESC